MHSGQCVISRITDCRITDQHIADCCAHCVFPAPEKRIRRVRRPVSSSPSDPACKMTPNPPDEALAGG
eukprot:4382304-Alexandrium_andersonii.AAC.1